jgi:hypothetical protein
MVDTSPRSTVAMDAILHRAAEDPRWEVIARRALERSVLLVLTSGAASGGGLRAVCQMTGSGPLFLAFTSLERAAAAVAQDPQLRRLTATPTVGGEFMSSLPVGAQLVINPGGPTALGLAAREAA